MNRVMSVRELMLKIMHRAYAAETSLLEGLPAIKDNVIGVDLRTLLDDELNRRKRDRIRLEAAFAILQEPANGATDELVQELISVQLHLPHSGGSGALTDSTIAALQQIIAMHLIGIYQYAIDAASALGYAEITRILRRTLLSEKKVSRKWKELARTGMPIEQPHKVLDE